MLPNNQRTQIAPFGRAAPKTIVRPALFSIVTSFLFAMAASGCSTAGLGPSDIEMNVKEEFVGILRLHSDKSTPLTGYREIRKLRRTSDIPAYSKHPFGVKLKFRSYPVNRFQVLVVWQYPKVRNADVQLDEYAPATLYNLEHGNSMYFYFVADSDLVHPGKYKLSVLLVGAGATRFKSASDLSDEDFGRVLYEHEFTVVEERT